MSNCIEPTNEKIVDFWSTFNALKAGMLHYLFQFHTHIQAHLQHPETHLIHLNKLESQPKHSPAFLAFHIIKMKKTSIRITIHHTNIKTQKGKIRIKRYVIEPVLSNETS